jgi:hypothetical protein
MAMSKPSTLLSDARVLAQSVTKDWERLNETNSQNSYAECRYCDASVIVDWQNQQASFDSIKHTTTCPVLVAKDILAGANEKEVKP